jgi:hypothetical protein
MSFGLAIMLMAILHALWRIADPKGTAEWDESISWIVGGVLAFVLVAGPLLALGFWIISNAHHIPPPLDESAANQSRRPRMAPDAERDLVSLRARQSRAPALAGHLPRNSDVFPARRA